MINKNCKKNSAYVLFIMGTTASGKTSLSIKLSKYIPIEIISVDSVSIYRGMNIGTSKPSLSQLKVVPHHLIDILDPSQSYSVKKFHQDTSKKIKKIIHSGKIPVLVGGTMMYFKSLLNGLSYLPKSNIFVRKYLNDQKEKNGLINLYKQLNKIDPITACKIHPNDSYRILRALEIFFISGVTVSKLIAERKKIFLEYKIYQFAFRPTDKISLIKRINNRFYKMLDAGLEEEVSTLFNRNDINKNTQSMKSIGYRQMWSYISGEISKNEMISDVIQSTKNLAKNQITWLKSWKDVHWLNSNDLNQSIKKIIEFLKYI